MARNRESSVIDMYTFFALQGGRSNKGAAAKVAKAAALAFAKRVLIRVQKFEAGHSCITDPALRERLFCVASSSVEVSPNAAMDVVKAGGAVAASAERMTSPSTAGEVASWYTVVLMIHILFECMCVDVCRRCVFQCK